MLTSVLLKHDIINIWEPKTNGSHTLVWFGFMVLNAAFNNISVISWRSLLLMEETGGQTLSHNVAYLILIEIRTHNISGDRHWMHSLVVVNPTTIRSRTWLPHIRWCWSQNVLFVILTLFCPTRISYRHM
jgi:hypothetical protein